MPSTDPRSELSALIVEEAETPPSILKRLARLERLMQALCRAVLGQPTYRPATSRPTVKRAAAKKGPRQRRKT